MPAGPLGETYEQEPRLFALTGTPEVSRKLEYHIEVPRIDRARAAQQVDGLGSEKGCPELPASLDQDADGLFLLPLFREQVSQSLPRVDFVGQVVGRVSIDR